MEPEFKVGDKVRVLPIADDPDKNYAGNTTIYCDGEVAHIIELTFDKDEQIFVYLLDIKDYGEAEFAEFELELYNEHIIKNIKNNDGRDVCNWCGGPTNKVQGFASTYNICSICNK